MTTSKSERVDQMRRAVDGAAAVALLAYLLATFAWPAEWSAGSPLLVGGGMLVAGASVGTVLAPAGRAGADRR